jgi:hypothetical protein
MSCKYGIYKVKRSSLVFNLGISKSPFLMLFETVREDQISTAVSSPSDLTSPPTSTFRWTQKASI